ncbi:MAG: prepilin-type N-terminal cleavage/methylation domain-containing protein [Anaerocolumna sp.]
MHIKLNSRGFTLVELVVAVSLLSVVLASAYFFLAFSQKVLVQTESQFDAIQDARMAGMKMEEDIRSAESVKIDVTRHKAVEVQDSGMWLTIYTDVDKDGIVQMVQYKLEDDELKRGVAALGNTPSAWNTVAGKVKNNMGSLTPIFSIDDKTVNIELLVLDEKEHLSENPVSVKTSITVRSKGAMD